MTSESPRESIAPDDDFGHLVRCQPQKVWQPRSAEEIVEIVTAARRDGVPIIARGVGHSVFGQSQIAGGHLVDMGAMRQVDIDGDVAIAAAGATWLDVLQASLAEGLTPTVLTDYIGLSVGGTLSVGGIGASSFRFGSQTDEVRALTVVTGTSELRVCSATREPALFDAARAGLGQIGIITHAQIPLKRAASHARHFLIPYSELGDMLEDLDRLAAEGRTDQVSAVGLIDPSGRWHYHIDAVAEFSAGETPDDAAILAGLRCKPADVAINDFPYLQYCARLHAQLASWRESGLWRAPHPWIDVFAPGPALAQLAESTIASLSPETLGSEAGMLLIYPIATPRALTPLLPIPTSSERAYLFDVLRCTPGASPADLQRLLHQNREVYERALALGGSLYPISAVAMTPADWQRHFGRSWAGFAAAKLRHDPDGVFGGYCRIPATATA